MVVLYVDLEHETHVRDAVRHPAYVLRLETARDRLEEAAKEPCDVIRYDEATLRTLAKHQPSAIVLSGMMTDWADFDFQSFEGLMDVIHAVPVPILGICAGQQLIGYAHGANWGPLGQLGDNEIDPDARFAPGARKERGFLPLETDPDCILFRSLGKRPRFFQTHYWHLRDTPLGFVNRASTPLSPIQVIERLDKPVFGVQFHPERYSAQYPAGRTLLRNFFAFASRL